MHLLAILDLNCWNCAIPVALLLDDRAATLDRATIVKGLALLALACWALLHCRQGLALGYLLFRKLGSLTIEDLLLVLLIFERQVARRGLLRRLGKVDLDAVRQAAVVHYLMLLYLRHLAEIRLVDASLLVRHDLDVLRIVRKQVLLVLLESFLAACLALLLGLLLLLLICHLLGCILIELLDLEKVSRLHVRERRSHRLLSSRG